MAAIKKVLLLKKKMLLMLLRSTSNRNRKREKIWIHLIFHKLKENFTSCLKT